MTCHVAREVRSSTGRGGLTLLEVAVAALVTILLLGILSRVLLAGFSAIRGVEGHLGALHAAQIQLERIENDLHHLLVLSKSDLSAFAGVALGSESRRAIGWHVARVGPSGRQPVYVGHRVRYEAVPAGDGTFHLSRDGVVDRHLSLERILFTLHVRPSAGGGPRLYFVKTTLVGIDPSRTRKLVLEGLTAIDTVGEWQANLEWNPNPDARWPALGVER